MALVLKTKSLKFLQEWGCDANGIATLKSLGIALQKGDDFITFWNGSKGYKLKIKLAGPVNPVSVMEELNSFMMFVLTEIENEKKAVGQPAWMNAKPSDPVQMSAKPVAEVIPLRDAKAMYQRVVGTSQGSVYVVVAMGEKHDVKIAAKIESGVNLSVRAEGNDLSHPSVRERLEKQGLKFKGEYMSGHYPCNSEAPPAKVLGAILMGSGIEFSTPMPKAEKVKEGSA
jgi:hypothetical protein